MSIGDSISVVDSISILCVLQPVHHLMVGSSVWYTESWIEASKLLGDGWQGVQDRIHVKTDVLCLGSQPIIQLLVHCLLDRGVIIGAKPSVQDLLVLSSVVLHSFVDLGVFVVH